MRPDPFSVPMLDRSILHAWRGEVQARWPRDIANANFIPLIPHAWRGEVQVNWRNQAPSVFGIDAIGDHDGAAVGLRLTPYETPLGFFLTWAVGTRVGGEDAANPGL